MKAPKNKKKVMKLRIDSKKVLKLIIFHDFMRNKSA